MQTVALTLRHGFSYENLMRSRPMPHPAVVDFLQTKVGPKAALYATTLFDLFRGCSVRMPFEDHEVPLTFGAQVKAFWSGVAAAEQGIVIDQVLRSPFLRVRQTNHFFLAGYQHVIGKEVPVRICDFLKERNGGSTFGYPDAYYAHLFPELSRLYRATPKVDYCPPNGETIREVYARVQSGLFSVLDEYPGQSVLIVTHEMVNFCIDALMLGVDMETRLKMPDKVPNLGMYRYVRADAGSWKVDQEFRGRVLV